MTNNENSADTRLATYGTLAPGRVNHDQLAGLNGVWRQGTVRGKLVEEGWGADLGYPGLLLDPSGEIVDVFIFESLDLPHHWSHLDKLEGAGYLRVVTQVRVENCYLDASIYVINA
ncbi:MAG: gamma-glutamylcyclotransferase [Hyphomicrobiales bacterium]|nr:gamma-glutamylcyclotransferase [Hyphomicrobiales bacterium]